MSDYGLQNTNIKGAPLPLVKTVIYDMLFKPNVSFFTYRYLSVNNDFFSKAHFDRIGFQLGLFSCTDEGRFGRLDVNNRGTKAEKLLNINAIKSLSSA